MPSPLKVRKWLKRLSAFVRQDEEGRSLKKQQIKKALKGLKRRKLAIEKTLKSKPGPSKRALLEKELKLIREKRKRALKLLREET